MASTAAAATTGAHQGGRKRARHHGEAGTGPVAEPTHRPRKRRRTLDGEAGDEDAAAAAPDAEDDPVQQGGEEEEDEEEDEDEEDEEGEEEEEGGNDEEGAEGGGGAEELDVEETVAEAAARALSQELDAAWAPPSTWRSHLTRMVDLETKRVQDAWANMTQARAKQIYGHADRKVRSTHTHTNQNASLLL